MPTSSIFADFSIHDNQKADAFARACEMSKANRSTRRHHTAILVKEKAQLDALFKKLNRKYECDSK